MTAFRTLVSLLRRYLDQHCALSDQDGLGALCECRICVETRAALASHDNAPEASLIDMLELDGPRPVTVRVAGFLRHYALMLRQGHPWDVPETIARACDNAARLLEVDTP